MRSNRGIESDRQAPYGMN